MEEDRGSKLEKGTALRALRAPGGHHGPDQMLLEPPPPPPRRPLQLQQRRPQPSALGPPADGRVRPRLPSPGLIPAATDGQTDRQADRPWTCLLLPATPGRCGAPPRHPQPGHGRTPAGPGAPGPGPGPSQGLPGHRPPRSAAGGGTAPAALLPLCLLGTAERGRGRRTQPGGWRRRGGPRLPRTAPRPGCPRLLPLPRRRPGAAAAILGPPRCCPAAMGRGGGS